jgi:N-acetylneuraminic acid mutarotase
MKKKSTSTSGFLSLRAITILFCATAACSILTVPLRAFLRSQEQVNGSQGTLTFKERVSYQRVIEEVYWRHRIWPKERPDHKPSLDSVMSQAQIEKKVENYLRNSQALEDYWQRPITAKQLQAEMDRMAEHTRQPEVLRELFAALGNDPFVIAECLARPALAERLVTNWYAYDQRFHGELRQRAEADLQAHNSVKQIKNISGRYSEIELVRSYGAQDEASRREHGPQLNRQEWDGAVQKLVATFNKPNTANQKAGEAYDALPIGKLSSLQEDEGSYYATAVIEKTEGRIKVSTVAWQKEPLESWLSKAKGRRPTAIATPIASYTLPEIPEGTACIDDTWAASAGPPDGRYGHTAVWTGSEMIIWGGGYTGYPNFLFRNTGARYSPSTDTWTSTSIFHAPTGRTSHTAVWTGTEMIIWGGADGFSVTNTGGRYNPTTNSWTATSTINAPTPRVGHAAVWTGAEMIVWGGTGADYFNTGGRYNPNTNRWSATSTANAPAGRYDPTAVWTGSEMIVWGGTDDITGLNTGGRYNPSTNSWTASSVSNAPTGRYEHTAVWTGTEMIVWGGYDVDNNQYLNTGGKYNPTSNTWAATSTTNVPAGLALHTAVWTGSLMIVWGGFNQVTISNIGGRYNPTTDSWNATSTMNAPTARALHTAIWTGSEMIVWSGQDDGGFTNTGGKYDPGSDTWTNTNAYDAPDARYLHTTVWTGSEMIVWGGTSYPNYFNTGRRYDPAVDSWAATSVAAAPSSRAVHTGLWTGSEMIIWGGHEENLVVLNTGGRYNPVTDSWTATSTANAPSARDSHTAVWSGDKMIVWGGWDEQFTFLNTGARYDPNADSWTATNNANAPSPRYLHTAIWAVDEMIIWGGTDDVNAFNTGGRYNPATDVWRATSTTNTPSGRAQHSAVWTGSEMIVWGGNGPFDTGGRYDPATDMWTATSMVNAPSGRWLHTAVWTGDEMIVWGGAFFDFGNFAWVPFSTGGRYNPSTDNWTPTNLTSAPDARYLHTAVWTGNEMIVWGGSGFGALNTGGIYCAQFGPTPTPSPTPSPRATPRPRPTSHVRPTPR